MDAGDVFEFFGQPVIHFVGAALRATENDRLSRLLAGHQPLEQIEFPLRIDREIKLVNRLDRDVLRRKIERFGIPHVPLGQPLDRRRHRGAQQQCLPRSGALAQNLFDVGPKADIEHPIGFIEDDEFQIAEIESPAAQMVDHSAGRADRDIDPLAKFFNLPAKRLAAVERDDVQSSAMGELHGFVAHLHGQLARRHQHERLRAGSLCMLAEPSRGSE